MVAHAAMGLLMLVAAPLAAHSGPPPVPGTLLRAWNWDLWAIAPVLVSGALYAVGLRALWSHAGYGRGIRRSEAVAFAGGWLALIVALISPLDALGSALFSAHMAQHMVLIAIAAPLLVLGRPVIAALWALPLGWRRALGALARRTWVRRAWGAATAPLGIWLVHGLAIWLWHAPRLYQATLRSEMVHVVQHLSFLGTAVIFWWVLLRMSRRTRWGPGVAILFVFTTMLHSSILGALLTFSPVGWYPAYEITAWWWGMTLLQDQQLGGLIMWVPGGLVYLISALALLAVWMRGARQGARRRSTLVASVGGEDQHGRGWPA